MLTRRGLLTWAAVGALAAGCGRSGGSTLSRARDAGSIRVGISGEEPYAYLDSSGQLTGESPAVAAAVLAPLGVTALEAVQRPFTELVPALLNGLFDVVTAGMAITPERCASVAFSAPDFVAPTAFLLDPRRRPRPRSFTDVARTGLAVAVLAGAVEQRQALSAGVPPARVVTCGDQSELWDAVSGERAQLGALTDISLRRLLGRHPGSRLAVNPIVPAAGGASTVSAGGFAFRPADIDLRQAFDAGLLALQRSGEWLRVATPFGVAESNRPPPTLTTAALCATR